MIIFPDQFYAVLTGDFIGSSRYAPETQKQALQILRDTISGFVKIHAAIESTSVETFRGDAWQLLLFPPSYAMHAAFLLRSSLISRGLPDTRVAVGIGRVDDLPGGSVREARGEAFILSGQALDQMKRSRHMVCEFGRSSMYAADQTAADIIKDSVNASLSFASRAADGWSAAEARAVWGTLQGMTQKEIGALGGEPVKQQTVRDALHRAMWDEIQNFLKIYYEIWSMKQAI